jgi:hypothetical protein
MLEFQPMPDLKSTANIEPAFCSGELGLRSGRAYAYTILNVKRKLKLPCKRSCKLKRLIIAAFIQAQAVKGDWDQAFRQCVKAVRECICQQGAELSSKSQLAPEFNRLDQGIQGISITKWSDTALVRWRILKATTTGSGYRHR